MHFSHEEKPNLAPKSPGQRAISTLKYHKFSGEGTQPLFQTLPLSGALFIACKSIFIWMSMHSRCISATVWTTIKKNKI